MVTKKKPVAEEPEPLVEKPSSSEERQVIQGLVNAIGRLRTVYLRSGVGRNLEVEKEVEESLAAANKLGIW